MEAGTISHIRRSVSSDDAAGHSRELIVIPGGSLEGPHKGSVKFPNGQIRDLRNGKPLIALEIGVSENPEKTL